jgi:tyrosyl-tRNA synthetase
MDKIAIEEILTDWKYISLAEYARAVNLAQVGIDAKLVTSKSEFNRLVDSGGIRLNGTKVNDPNAYIFFPPNKDLTDINSSVIMSIDRKRAEAVGI